MSEEHGWIIGKDISAREFGDAFCKAVDMAIEEFKKENPKQTIESLQAKIRKKESQKNEFYASLQDALSLIERMSDEKEAKDARIKDLEQQLAKQQAWIGKLEEAWIVADGNILSMHRDRLRLDQVSEEKRLRYRQEAKEALEKLKV